VEKLRLAKDMLRHALPTGDDEAILDRALSALLEKLTREKFGAEGRAGSSLGSAGSAAESLGSSSSSEPMPAPVRLVDPDSRHVPAAVKRAVWVRDLGRCAYVGAEGHRCDERAFLQFHHVRPYAVGGAPTVENTQLRCARHNRHEAEVFFAREPVDQIETTRGRRGRSGTSGTGSVRPASAAGRSPVALTTAG
jgi:hypothetical protein